MYHSDRTSAKGYGAQRHSPSSSSSSCSSTSSSSYGSLNVSAVQRQPFVEKSPQASDRYASLFSGNEDCVGETNQEGRREWKVQREGQRVAGREEGIPMYGNTRDDYNDSHATNIFREEESYDDRDEANTEENDRLRGNEGSSTTAHHRHHHRVHVKRYVALESSSTVQQTNSATSTATSSTLKRTTTTTTTSTTAAAEKSNYNDDDNNNSTYDYVRTELLSGAGGEHQKVHKGREGAGPSNEHAGLGLGALSSTAGPSTAGRNSLGRRRSAQRLLLEAAVQKSREFRGVSLPPADFINTNSRKEDRVGESRAFQNAVPPPATERDIFADVSPQTLGVRIAPVATTPTATPTTRDHLQHGGISKGSVSVIAVVNEGGRSIKGTHHLRDDHKMKKDRDGSDSEDEEYSPDYFAGRTTSSSSQNKKKKEALSWRERAAELEGARINEKHQYQQPQSKVPTAAKREESPREQPKTVITQHNDDHDEEALAASTLRLEALRARLTSSRAATTTHHANSQRKASPSSLSPANNNYNEAARLSHERLIPPASLPFSYRSSSSISPFSSSSSSSSSSSVSPSASIPAENRNNRIGLDTNNTNGFATYSSSPTYGGHHAEKQQQVGIALGLMSPPQTRTPTTNTTATPAAAFVSPSNSLASGQRGRAFSTERDRGDEAVESEGRRSVSSSGRAQSGTAVNDPSHTPDDEKSNPKNNFPNGRSHNVRAEKMESDIVANPRTIPYRRSLTSTSINEEGNEDEGNEEGDTTDANTNINIAYNNANIRDGSEGSGRSCGDNVIGKKLLLEHHHQQQQQQEEEEQLITLQRLREERSALKARLAASAPLPPAVTPVEDGYISRNGGGASNVMANTPSQKKSVPEGANGDNQKYTNALHAFKGNEVRAGDRINTIEDGLSATATATATVRSGTHSASSNAKEETKKEKENDHYLVIKPILSFSEIVTRNAEERMLQIKVRGRENSIKSIPVPVRLVELLLDKSEPNVAGSDTKKESRNGEPPGSQGAATTIELRAVGIQSNPSSSFSWWRVRPDRLEKLILFDSNDGAPLLWVLEEMREDEGEKKEGRSKFLQPNQRDTRGRSLVALSKNRFFCRRSLRLFDDASTVNNRVGGEGDERRADEGASGATDMDKEFKEGVYFEAMDTLSDFFIERVSWLRAEEERLRRTRAENLLQTTATDDMVGVILGGEGGSVRSKREEAGSITSPHAKNKESNRNNNNTSSIAGPSTMGVKTAALLDSSAAILSRSASASASLLEALRERKLQDLAVFRHSALEEKLASIRKYQAFKKIVALQQREEREGKSIYKKSNHHHQWHERNSRTIDNLEDSKEINGSRRSASIQRQQNDERNTEMGKKTELQLLQTLLSHSSTAGMGGGGAKGSKAFTRESANRSSSADNGGVLGLPPKGKSHSKTQTSTAGGMNNSSHDATAASSKKKPSFHSEIGNDGRIHNSDDDEAETSFFQPYLDPRRQFPVGGRDTANVSGNKNENNKSAVASHDHELQPYHACTLHAPASDHKNRRPFAHWSSRKVLASDALCVFGIEERLAHLKNMMGSRQGEGGTAGHAQDGGKFVVESEHTGKEAKVVNSVATTTFEGFTPSVVNSLFFGTPFLSKPLTLLRGGHKSVLQASALNVSASLTDSSLAPRGSEMSSERRHGLGGGLASFHSFLEGFRRDSSGSAGRDATGLFSGLGHSGNRSSISKNNKGAKAPTTLVGESLPLTSLGLPPTPATTIGTHNIQSQKHQLFVASPSPLVVSSAGSPLSSSSMLMASNSSTSEFPPHEDMKNSTATNRWHSPITPTMLQSPSSFAALQPPPMKNLLVKAMKQQGHHSLPSPTRTSGTSTPLHVSSTTAAAAEEKSAAKSQVIAVIPRSPPRVQNAKLVAPTRVEIAFLGTDAVEDSRLLRKDSSVIRGEEDGESSHLTGTLPLFVLLPIDNEPFTNEWATAEPSLLLEPSAGSSSARPSSKQTQRAATQNQRDLGSLQKERQKRHSQQHPQRLANANKIDTFTSMHTADRSLSSPSAAARKAVKDLFRKTSMKYAFAVAAWGKAEQQQQQQNTMHPTLKESFAAGEEKTTTPAGAGPEGRGKRTTTPQSTFKASGSRPSSNTSNHKRIGAPTTTSTLEYVLVKRADVGSHRYTRAPKSPSSSSPTRRAEEKKTLTKTNHDDHNHDHDDAVSNRSSPPPPSSLTSHRRHKKDAEPRRSSSVRSMRSVNDSSDDEDVEGRALARRSYRSASNISRGSSTSRRSGSRSRSVSVGSAAKGTTRADLLRQEHVTDSIQRSRFSHNNNVDRTKAMQMLSRGKSLAHIYYDR